MHTNNKILVQQYLRHLLIDHFKKKINTTFMINTKSIEKKSLFFLKSFKKIKGWHYNNVVRIILYFNVKYLNLLSTAFQISKTPYS